MVRVIWQNVPPTDMVEDGSADGAFWMTKNCSTINALVYASHSHFAIVNAATACSLSKFPLILPHHFPPVLFPVSFLSVFSRVETSECFVSFSLCKSHRHDEIFFIFNFSFVLKDVEPRGSIHLSSVLKCEAYDSKSHSFAFDVVTGDKSFLMHADNTQDRVCPSTTTHQFLFSPLALFLFSLFFHLVLAHTLSLCLPRLLLSVYTPFLGLTLRMPSLKLAMQEDWIYQINAASQDAK